MKENKLQNRIKEPEESETFWETSVVGKEVSKKIQELCQEYWEAGFNTGMTFKEARILEKINNLQTWYRDNGFHGVPPKKILKRADDFRDELIKQIKGDK